jgi:hypothetical protein
MLSMAFVMLHFAISAVGRLKIQEISDPMSLVLRQLYDYLPKVLVGALLLGIGLVVARIVARAGRAVLAGIGFNALLVNLGLVRQMSDAARQQEAEGKKTLEAGVRRARGEAVGAEVEDVLTQKAALQTPSDVAGSVLGGVVFIIFLQQALRTIGLEGMARMVDSLLAFLPHVLVALVVVAAGMWAGRWCKARIDQLTRLTTDKLVRSLGTVAHVAVVTVAVMVALQQLGVAATIIDRAFTLILGALCLAAALALGLGGRDVAAEVVRKHYEKVK